MEAAALAFSVAQTILTALQFPEVKEMFFICGYASKLESLEETVNFINAVLQDAQAKEELSQQQLNFVQRLKAAVYDADDLLDQFFTRAQQHQLQHSSSGKVYRLISPFKKLSLARQMSREIKNIREKLDGIATDANKFGFKCDNNQAIIRRERIRKETCSYVYAENVIGREDDKRDIVDKLLDPNVKGLVPVLSIVGIGGLGKTTLAQLVFNDERIVKEFPMRLWVCVSDQYQNQWNVNAILANILKSATDEKDVDKYVIEQVVRKLRGKLDRSKYLLVLDDVWTEVLREWIDLEEYLLGLGQRGSRILVTTRSKKTAEIVGRNTDIMHELKGLSEDDSWRLFESIVGEEKANNQDFMDIGKDILKKCAYVPLAIRVIGSLLHGEDKNKWQSFQQSAVKEIRNRDNAIVDIIPILKFSYHNLSPPLKSCFSYCAVFPKDFVIEKYTLISLWMAQGFLEPSDGVQSMEDVGEEYFQIFLQRCFFQDIEKDGFDEIQSCKMHDLMHDVAQEVAGKEIVVANSSAGNLIDGVQIHHICVEGDPNNCGNSFISKAQIRTYLQAGSLESRFPLSMLLKKWMNLRALCLADTRLESLPDDIGKLLHLRYLDLSGSNLNMLPKSITKLVNLQTLNLNWLDELKKLPKELNKLVKLRVLNISYCSSLKHMPARMDKLTCLNRLSMFVVGKRDSSRKQHGVDKLEDLRALEKLKGRLKIRIDKKYAVKKEINNRGAGYISNKEHLNRIMIEWFNENEEERGIDSQEDLLESLQPHRNLKEFTVLFYDGKKIPRWAIKDSLTTSLPNLIRIGLGRCSGLQSLPWLGKLPFLKNLEVSNLTNVEYMEDRTSGSDSTASYGSAAQAIQESSSFFPSLERLSLDRLPKLKGWWGGLRTSGLVMEDDEIMSIQTAGPHPLPSFPSLCSLTIRGCRYLTVIPLCPTVETLDLLSFNERLGIMTHKEEDQKEERGSNDSKMRYLTTDNARHLKSLPMVAFQCLVKMTIDGDKELKSVSEIEMVFRSCSSSLRSLRIDDCSRLRSVLGGLEYLTALESLELVDLPELRFDETEGEEEEEEEATCDGMPWKCLAQSLHSLELWNLSNAIDLPKGMRYLTALQSLKIAYHRMKELPEWIGCLSSLQSLLIEKCEHLKSLPEALRKLASLQQLEIIGGDPVIERRCEKSNGEDWPKIQHIPNIRFKVPLPWEYP